MIVKEFIVVYCVRNILFCFLLKKSSSFHATTSVCIPLFSYLFFYVCFLILTVQKLHFFIFTIFQLTWLHVKSCQTTAAGLKRCKEDTTILIFSAITFGTWYTTIFQETKFWSKFKEEYIIGSIMCISINCTLRGKTRWCLDEENKRLFCNKLPWICYSIQSVIFHLYPFLFLLGE